MIACLVYSYGQNADGTVADQTKARCDKAVALWKKRKIEMIYMTVAWRQAGVLMCDAMRDYLISQGVPCSLIITFPCGNNTAGETDAFIKHVLLYYCISTPSLVVVSSWYHIPRIRWLWFVRRLPVKCYGAKGSVHFSDLRIEPIKMLYALIRPIKSAKLTHNM